MGQVNLPKRQLDKIDELRLSGRTSAISRDEFARTHVEWGIRLADNPATYASDIRWAERQLYLEMLRKVSRRAGVLADKSWAWQQEQ